jgi:zinc protease
MRRFSFLVSLLAVLTCCAQSLAQAPQKRTLPNGLTILVQENHAAPVVAVRFYVKTGSIYEEKYLGAGISHLFEHVLQEGSKTRTKEQINQEAQAIGGQTNAYTTDEVTAYHITTASRYFNRALDNLADSLMNATFPEAEVKTQQGIIHHEMEMDEDDPNRVLYDVFQANAFLVHPIRFPTIGYRAPFDRLTREDILNYYNSHYTPNNTILAVAGDVKAEEVFAAAQKSLGSWEQKSGGQPAIPDEPAQTTARRVVVEKPVQNASIMVGWHTIPLQHPDLYALDALAGVLGGGESSRLVQELREKQELVYEVSAWSSTPNYNAGTFVIRASLPPQKLDAFESAVWRELNKIKKLGVSTLELKRAQRQIETAFVFNNDVEAQAERMAYDYMGTGNPNYSGQYVARINAVTPTQVQAAARKYLLAQGTTVAIVQPPTKAGATSGGTTSTPTRAGAVKPPQFFTLKNGLRVIIRENHTTPTVAIGVMGLGGARFETPDKSGLASVTAELLERGTTKRSAAAFSEIVDSLGATFETSSGYNAWTLSSNWLARDWRRGLALVHESLSTPAFPQAELSRVKSLTLAGIKQQEDDPDSVASQLVRKEFFGAHPYGRSPLGTPATVQKISRNDVVQFWQEVRNPNDTVIAIYGDVKPGEARRATEYLFGNWRPFVGIVPNKYRPQSAPVEPLQKPASAEKSKPDIQQTVLYFAYPGLDVKSEDRYALTVLDGALSGIYYPGGRLHARLRDNQLVYGVHAFPMSGMDGGAFLVVASTTKDKRDEVKGIIEEEVDRIRSADISSEELERAKGMAITSRAVDLQTNGGQAGNAVSDELFGLGYKNGESYESKINAVTLQDVRRVAQKYLRPENSAYAVVQPE